MCGVNKSYLIKTKSASNKSSIMNANFVVGAAVMEAKTFVWSPKRWVAVDHSEPNHSDVVTDIWYSECAW